MGISSRLIDVIKHQNKPMTEVAKSIGMPYRSMQNYISGQRTISTELIEKLNTILGIDSNWMLTGKGAMYKTESSVKDDYVVEIPEYDITLSAGLGLPPPESELIVNTHSFTKEWLSKKGLQASSLSLVKVTGDSMEPLLKNKDVVMIDTNKIKPAEGLAFAIRLDGDLLVKNIQRTGDGLWSLVSQNKAYDNIIINPKKLPDDFAIIGSVVWYARSFV